MKHITGQTLIYAMQLIRAGWKDQEIMDITHLMPEQMKELRRRANAK